MPYSDDERPAADRDQEIGRACRESQAASPAKVTEAIGSRLDACDRIAGGQTATARGSVSCARMSRISCDRSFGLNGFAKQ